MNYENINFALPHLPLSTFKQRPVSITVNSLCTSRMGIENLRFEGYAKAEYTDEKENAVNITVFDGFTRSKTNCLVFTLLETEKNTSIYNKLFIFHYDGYEESNYHYVMYNDTTKRWSHIYFTDHENDNLCISLTRTFGDLMDPDTWKKRIEQRYRKATDRDINGDPNISKHANLRWTCGMTY